MSAPPSLLRSAPHTVHKFPSLTATYRTRHVVPYAVQPNCRSLATVNQDQSVLLDVGFARSGFRSSIVNPNSPEPHKPPDERTVKLGKSELSPPPTCQIQPANHPASSSNTPRTPSNPSSIATAPGNPLPSNHTPPLSLYAPAPPHRLGPRRLLRCPVDVANRMGPRASRREREAADHLRAHDQESGDLAVASAAIRDPAGAANCPVADDREDEE